MTLSKSKSWTGGEESRLEGSRSPKSPKSPKKHKGVVDEPVPDKLVDMLRRAADFEKQSRECSQNSKASRFTQSCASFRTMGSMASSKLSRAVSLRQQTSRVLASRGRHSPSSSHGKYRIGQLSKLGQGMFRLPEIAGAKAASTSGSKGGEAKATNEVPKKEKGKTRRRDGPQEVSLEAARAYWDLTSQEVRLPRTNQEEDRRHSSNTRNSTQNVSRSFQHSGPGVPELSVRVGLPQQVATEAAHLFQRFADIPTGGSIFDGKFQCSRLPEVLVALCDLSDASELDKKFLERAQRAAERDSGHMDIEEFAVWYSSFCFAEEVTVRPQARQTRELARHMGLEIWAIEKFRVAFDKYDADGSGEIEFDEFSDMVQELQTPHVFQTFFFACSLGGSGTLTVVSLCIIGCWCGVSMLVF